MRTPCASIITCRVCGAAFRAVVAKLQRRQLQPGLPPTFQPIRASPCLSLQLKHGTVYVKPVFLQGTPVLLQFEPGPCSVGLRFFK